MFIYSFSRGLIDDGISRSNYVIFGGGTNEE